MGVELGLDQRGQQVVRGVDVVVDRVALVARGLHRVRRGALLGEVHDRVGPEVARAARAARRSRGRRRPASTSISWPVTSLPRAHALAERADRRERAHLELVVDPPARQVVDDRRRRGRGRTGTATSAIRRNRRRQGPGPAEPRYRGLGRSVSVHARRDLNARSAVKRRAALPSGGRFFAVPSISAGAAPSGPTTTQHDETSSADDRDRPHDDRRRGERRRARRGASSPTYASSRAPRPPGVKMTTSPKAHAMPAAPATSSGSCKPETAAWTSTAARDVAGEADEPVARRARTRGGSRRVRRAAGAAARRRSARGRPARDATTTAAAAQGERGAAERERGAQRDDVLGRDSRDPVDGRAADEHGARGRRPDAARQVAQGLRAAPHAHVLARRMTRRRGSPSRAPAASTTRARRRAPGRAATTSAGATARSARRRRPSPRRCPRRRRTARPAARGGTARARSARPATGLMPGGAPAPRSSG